MRGKLRSRSGDVVEAEARGLVAQGVTELSLVSQDSVMWGRDTEEGDLASLLARLERIDGLRRIRLMYLHPQGVTDGLIDLMLGSDVVTSYFDLSLQHVAPSVLRGMGRWGDRGRFERMIGRIRAGDERAGVRSTFILGFPGETDPDATAVEQFVEEVDLDWVGVFTYSREEGTRSFALDDQVEPDVARERAERVTRAAEITMARRAETFVGTSLEVLVERLDRATGEWMGRSAREAPEVDGEITFASDQQLHVGDYVDVVVTAAEGTDLRGRVAR
jgi:ribosomal protein S12 methylthiotransferase